MDNVLIRYTPLSRYDLAAFGTLAKVIGENDDEYELYIQLSRDSQIANWRKVRHLLEVVLKDKLLDKEFIDACLELYENKDTDLNRLISSLAANS
jgi:hypothetical protein